MGEISKKVQERTLKWYGHVMRTEAIRRKERNGSESTREEGGLREDGFRVRGDIKEKGLSEEEVYDRATRRRISLNIDST